jgi:hypothetical protein
MSLSKNMIVNDHLRRNGVLVPHLKNGRRSVIWLRYYTTSHRVVGSIPDKAIGFFNLPRSSSRIVTLGSTQPLTEIE